MTKDIDKTFDHDPVTNQSTKEEGEERETKPVFLLTANADLGLEL